MVLSMIQKGDNLYIYGEIDVCKVIKMVFGRYPLVRSKDDKIFIPKKDDIIGKQEELF